MSKHDNMKSMSRSRKITQTILIVLLTVLSVITVLPFLLVISASFSNETDVAMYGFRLIPKKIDLSAYKYVFETGKPLWQGYRMTIFVSFVKTALMIFFNALMAYPLSRKAFLDKGKFTMYLYITTLFSGGAAASYILITQYLHLGNTIWVYLIPGIISPWMVFYIRTFFNGIPYEISESAFMDGAGHFTIFWKFMLPLSKPILATQALGTFLGTWNDWYTSMLYVRDTKLQMVQWYLQRIIMNANVIKMAESEFGLKVDIEIPMETTKMAMAVVVAGPALFVFPFFQKYFAKGMVVGSVKG